MAHIIRFPNSHTQITIDTKRKITTSCFLCAVPFQSRGIGDRVCKDCKNKSEWKKGSFIGPFYGIDP